jgi:hypothetical protein
MADLTQTRANVKIESDGLIGSGVGGEAFDQGVPLYQNGTKYFKADANDTAAKAEAIVISLTPCGGDGRRFVFARPGADIDLGATLQQGEVYVVSATAGAICPVGDITASGAYKKILGTAKSTSLLAFNPDVLTVQNPTTTTTTTTT